MTEEQRLRAALEAARDLIDNRGSAADLWNHIDAALGQTTNVQDIRKMTENGVISMIQCLPTDADFGHRVVEAIDLLAGAVLELAKDPTSR